MYNANDTVLRAVIAMKYLDPGVNIARTYFCTYTTNHSATNTAVRKDHYSACALITLESPRRPATALNMATIENTTPVTSNASIVPVTA